MTPEHMSFSALRQYEDCGRAYYLSRYVKAEAKQTYFFPLGTAVHQSIESYIKGEFFSTREIFFKLVEDQMKIDPDDVNWLSGGPVDNPTIRGRALEIAEQCVGNAIIFLEDMDVWEVEYDATGMLPGCEVPIKAFVDIIGEHKKHGPCIVDWKSGKQKPKTNLQLETYASLLSQPSISGNDHLFTEHGSLAFRGLWAMLHPEASKARPVDLSNVDASALGARYQKAYEQIKKKVWKPNPGFDCKFCIMAPNCNVESPMTERSNYYDKSSEEGIPF